MQRSLKRNSRFLKQLSSALGLLLISAAPFAVCGADKAYITHVSFPLYNWASADQNVSVYGQAATTTKSKTALDNRSTGEVISPNPNPTSPAAIPFGGSGLIIDPSADATAIDCYTVAEGGSATTYYSLAFLVSDSTEDAQHPNLFLTAVLHQIYQNVEGTISPTYDLTLTDKWFANPVTSCSGSAGQTAGCALLSQSTLLSNTNWVLNGSFSDVGAFPYSASSAYSVLQSGLANSSATQLLWPSSLKFNAVNNFYGVASFAFTVPTPQSKDSSTIINDFAIVCENITGVGNTCPWFGVDNQGSRPQVPPLS